MILNCSILWLIASYTCRLKLELIINEDADKINKKMILNILKQVCTYLGITISFLVRATFTFHNPNNQESILRQVCLNYINKL